MANTTVVGLPLANLARRASDDREPAGGGPGASDLDFDAAAGAAADSDGADLEGVVAASAAADLDGRNDLDKDGHKERQVVLVAFNFWLKIRILRLVCIEHCRLILWLIRRLLVCKRNPGEIEHLGRGTLAIQASLPTNGSRTLTRWTVTRTFLLQLVQNCSSSKSSPPQLPCWLRLHFQCQ